MGLEFVGMLEPVKTTEINGKINWLKQFEPRKLRKNI